MCGRWSVHNGGKEATAFFFTPVGKNIAEQFGDDGAANEHKWCVVTQQGPVDKERRVQPGPKKEDRRFWGASKHSPIISQRKASSSSSAVTHMYASSLAKRHNSHQTDYRKGKVLLPDGRRSFRKQNTVCSFSNYFFYCSSAKQK